MCLEPAHIMFVFKYLCLFAPLLLWVWDPSWRWKLIKYHRLQPPTEAVFIKPAGLDRFSTDVYQERQRKFGRQDVREKTLIRSLWSLDAWKIVRHVDKIYYTSFLNTKRFHVVYRSRRKKLPIIYWWHASILWLFIRPPYARRQSIRPTLYK